MPDMTDEVEIFIRTLEFIGTFAGAVSGVRLASAKRFDWFGASVIGVVTAVGGGTLRDVLMQIKPFWMTDPFYLGTSCLAVVAVGLFGRRFISGQITWFIFDTISISIFMMIGLQKAIVYGSRSDLSNYELDDLIDYGFWFADYSSRPQMSLRMGIWQYSDSATVDGIKEKVDLDLDLMGVLATS